MTIPRKWLLLWLALPVACGFHPRGSHPDGVGMAAESMAEVTVHVSERAATETAKELRERLLGAGFALARHAAEADWLIQVRDERQERRLLSIDPATTKTREYELYAWVSLTILDAQGNPALEGELLERSQDMVYDEYAVLSMEEEQRTLTMNLRRELADAVLFRLRRQVLAGGGR